MKVPKREKSPTHGFLAVFVLAGRDMRVRVRSKANSLQHFLPGPMRVHHALSMRYVERTRGPAAACPVNKQTRFGTKLTILVIDSEV